jgi:Glycosyl hydrolases family 18
LVFNTIRVKAASAAPRAVGYLPWWMAAGWDAMPLAHLDRAVLFDAPLQPDGSLLERAWPAPVRRSRLPADLALSLFGQGDFDRLFGDAATRRRLLAASLRALQQPHVAGLHLDIEGYGAAQPGAVAGFRDWLLKLDDERRAAGKGLSAFFPASDTFSAYDPVVAARIDYWVVQVYDAHWVHSKTTGPLVTRHRSNPVAVPRALARLAALGVPRELMLLSVPLYGWQWQSDAEHPGSAALGPAKLLTYAQTPRELMPNDRLAASELARQHGLRRDEEHTPYYAYREGEHWVQGWYEDFASLTRKLAPERTQAYAGLAFFPLGYDHGAIVEPLLRWWRG